MAENNPQVKTATDPGFAARESTLFEAWERAGYFQRGEGRGDFAHHPFTIVIPPPNITGVLHTH